MDRKFFPAMEEDLRCGRRPTRFIQLDRLYKLLVAAPVPCAPVMAAALDMLKVEFSSRCACIILLEQ